MSSEKPTLFSYWRSSSSWRVRIALALKGIDYEYRAVDLLKAEQTSPEYIKHNPLQMIPCLIDKGVSLVESVPILEYLDEAYPNTQPLLPKYVIISSKARSHSNDLKFL
eukprot:TRINITY_DN2936_c0_g1_i2.p1 TRINITY_DN2936_c0_g1~~TRINITY_DN2936_c0_g1_i2.p1  ORF type:complete len:124 (+),score=6.08 TRINITY_DN2936_c0_g1_i2:47-373(+)